MTPAGERASPLAERARFLFRNEQGTVDAATWRLHAGWLLLLLAALTAGWFALRPYTHHDLATSPLFVPMVVVAFAYLIAYSFAVLVIAVSYVMLSMKRFRALHAPAALAGVVPLLALLAASAHFLRTQTPDVVAVWYVVALDVALVAATLWTAVELGIRPTLLRERPPGAL